jgi:hypothetical protein
MLARRDHRKLPRSLRHPSQHAQHCQCRLQPASNVQQRLRSAVRAPQVPGNLATPVERISTAAQVNTTSKLRNGKRIRKLTSC